MPTENITEAWLAKIAADENRAKPAALPAGLDRERYWDESLPGFGVVVGARFATFVAKHRVGGKQRLVTIGRYGRPGAGEEHADVWTVARARKDAMRLLGQMSSGVDPAKEEHAGTATLRDAFKAHKERLNKKGRAAATVVTLEKTMKRLGDDWLDRPLAELRGSMLVELHDRIKRETAKRTGAKNAAGAPLANRVIANISAAWNTLNRQLEGALGNWNPARSVEKDKLRPKRTRIDNDTLSDWYARVQTMRNPIQRDGLVFTLFTGLRNEDVRSVRFEHVDEDAGTLRLPDPKGGPDAAFTIPLSKTCLDIVDRRKKGNREALGGATDKGWCFPGPDAEGAIGAIADLRQQTHDKGKHGRFPAEDVHTLRRTYESVAHEAGVSELDQHVLTNHSFGSRNVNQTYISQHIDHLARCQATIEAALWARIQPEPKRGRAADAKKATAREPKGARGKLALVK